MIYMKINRVLMPLTNPIVSLEAQNVTSGGDILSSSEKMPDFEIIRTCEPANLIFPLHFSETSRFGHHSLLFTKKVNSKNCYT